MRSYMALARHMLAIEFLVLHAHLVGEESLVSIGIILSMRGGIFLSSNTLLALFLSVGMALYH